jgi:hypothetical protein
VVKLLTGLGSGEASAQLKLAAAYCAAGKSYGDCRRDMAVHYGQDLERTKLRRLALEVEQSAMAFAEAERAAQLERIGGEAQTVGVPLVLLEADGGKVRTGTLTPCEPGDAGYGRQTPKRDLPRRKRPVSWREVITMDAREPGTTDATALDVLVPLGAPSGWINFRPARARVSGRDECSRWLAARDWAATPAVLASATWAPSWRPPSARRSSTIPARSGAPTGNTPATM